MVAKDARVLVLARALQGSGAISSVLLALVADLTREEVRTQAMARVGIWIGATFGVALIVGPPLATLIGIPFLFAITGFMAVGSMIYLRFGIPDPPVVHPEDRLHAADLPTILRHPPVLLVDIGVFLLHTVVTLLFVLLPFELQRIDVYFWHPSAPPPRDIQLLVYVDPTGSGNPANSTLVQELSFQKPALLETLTRLLPDERIRDLRFRVGPID